MKMRYILQNIVANARVIPDPSMNGTTDCYAVPLGDIEDAKEILAVTLEEDAVWIPPHNKPMSGE